MDTPKFWRRASGLRFVLVVAATCAITLTASSAVDPALHGWHVTGRAAASPLAETEGAAAKADCTMATALRVGKPFFFDPSSKKPVGQVLCGPFTGAGSEAMVVSFTAPTCWSPQGWAVFRFSEGDWRLVMVRRLVFVVAPLIAVGTDIRETTPVYRRGDPRCIPSGGRTTRIWHWNGTRFEASPWKQVTAAAAASRGFRSPSGNISCGVGDTRGYRGVTCQSYEPIQRVAMDARGRLKICRGSLIRCQVRDPGDPPILRYGRQITVGRFRCLSLRSGVRCTVIRSGKGFLINSQGVARVGR